MQRRYHSAAIEEELVRAGQRSIESSYAITNTSEEGDREEHVKNEGRTADTEDVHAKKEARGAQESTLSTRGVFNFSSI